MKKCNLFLPKTYSSKLIHFVLAFMFEKKFCKLYRKTFGQIKNHCSNTYRPHIPLNFYFFSNFYIFYIMGRHYQRKYNSKR